MLPRPGRGALLALALALLPAAAPAARSRLELHHTRIDLPGAPSAVVSTDLDGDGRRDLLVVVAYTRWDQIGIEEQSEMAGIEGLVEVLTIIPSLVDRRELWAFRGQEGGTYVAASPPLDLPPSVLALVAGGPGLPAVALTDDGVAALRYDAGASQKLRFEPMLADPPVLAGTGTFVPRLELLHDLDGDGQPDLLLPAADGAAVYLRDSQAFRAEAAARLVLPTDERTGTGSRTRHYPLPQVRDIDGDRLPDLLFPDRREGWQRFHVLVNAGGGHFRPAVAPLGEAPEEEEAEDDDEDAAPAVVHFGDLDGDGVAEYVTVEDLSDDDAGMRQSIREAKRPPVRFRLHRQRPDLGMESAPFQEIAATGYAFESGDDEDNGFRLPGGFQDLDGDGRQDLVALTLDFSMLQAVRILAVRSIDIGLDFHLWCQGDDGRFREVQGLDLSGRFRLHLDDLRIGQLSQFAGDFDGDGRADFVQMGRGRKVTIHRGGQGCVYAPTPDLTVELDEAPRDLSLVRVEDLDADGLSDLVVIQPRRAGDPGVTAPVSLDLYLSGGAP